MRWSSAEWRRPALGNHFDGRYKASRAHISTAMAWLRSIKTGSMINLVRWDRQPTDGVHFVQAKKCSKNRGIIDENERSCPRHIISTSYLCCDGPAYATITAVRCCFGQVQEAHRITLPGPLGFSYQYARHDCWRRERVEAGGFGPREDLARGT